MRFPSRLLMLAVPALLAAQPAHAGPLRAPTDLRLGILRGPLVELYAPESLESRVSAVERTMLDARWSHDAGRELRLRLTRGSYQIADPDFPGTIHQRTETGLLVATLWQAGCFSYGLGYDLQSLTVDSTAKAPGSEPAFLFAGWQAIHGPALLGGLRMGLAGPFGLAVDAELVPYAWAPLADARLAMPGLSSVRVAPRLTFWDERGALGMFYERTFGTGFYREQTGAIGSLRLTGF